MLSLKALDLNLNYEIRLIGCTEVEELPYESAAVQNHSFPANGEIYRESRALPPLFLKFLTAGNIALAAEGRWLTGSHKYGSMAL
jgi:hypothetical protein